MVFKQLFTSEINSIHVHWQVKWHIHSMPLLYKHWKYEKTEYLIMTCSTVCHYEILKSYFDKIKIFADSKCLGCHHYTFKALFWKKRRNVKNSMLWTPIYCKIPVSLWDLLRLLTYYNLWMSYELLLWCHFKAKSMYIWGDFLFIHDGIAVKRIPQ